MNAVQSVINILYYVSSNLIVGTITVKIWLIFPKKIMKNIFFLKKNHEMIFFNKKMIIWTEGLLINGSESKNAQWPHFLCIRPKIKKSHTIHQHDLKINPLSGFSILWRSDHSTIKNMQKLGSVMNAVQSVINILYYVSSNLIVWTITVKIWLIFPKKIMKNIFFF